MVARSALYLQYTALLVFPTVLTTGGSAMYVCVLGNEGRCNRALSCSCGAVDLCVAASQVTLLLYYILGVRLGREHFLRVTAVGYSAVIFGWCAF